MRVTVHLLTTSKAKVYEEADNCYTKDGMYCVLLINELKSVVHKYPLVNIFRIEEDY